MKRNELIYVVTLMAVASILLYVSAKPSKTYGHPLSVYSANKTGIRALYLLSRKLGYNPVIHTQSLILIPRGAKTVFTQTRAENVESESSLESSIERAFLRGQKLVFLAPLPSGHSIEEEVEKISRKTSTPVAKNKLSPNTRMQDYENTETNEGKEQGRDFRFPSKASQPGEPMPTLRVEKDDKPEVLKKLAKNISRKVFELEWSPSPHGIVITTTNYSTGHKYFRGVSVLRSETLNLAELESLSRWEAKIGQMNEAYVLKGSLKPILGIRKTEKGELIALFAPHFLTNGEIGSEDNVVFAHNIISPEAGTTGLYFLESTLGLFNTPIGLTGILFFTEGGKLVLFLLIVVLGYLLPSIFGLGRHYSSVADKFPPPYERIKALASLLQKEKLFRESFKFAISFLNPTVNVRDLHQLSEYLTKDLGLKEDKARKIQELLFSETSARASEREKRLLIETYKDALLRHKPRSVF